VLHQVRIEASESLVVPLLREDVRFEPVQRGCERDARLPPLARGQHPKRRVRGQPLSIVGVLVAREAAVERLESRMRAQSRGLVAGKSKHEVFRKPREISPNGLDQCASWNVVERGEIGVEHHTGNVQNVIHIWSRRC
jgi:hypothetical protein